jgi:Spy/CpxP family protein refolding chaperone
MRKTKCTAGILFLAVILVLGSQVLAGPGRFGGRGPGFGPGARGWQAEDRPPMVWGRGMGPGCPFGLGGGAGLGMFGGPGGPGRGLGFGAVIRRLDLSDEQLEKITTIQEAAMEKMEAGCQAVADAVEALREAAGAEEPDEAAIQQAGTALGTAIGQQAVLRAKTMASIKQVLTDEQRESVKTLMERAKELRGFPGRFGGGRRGRGLGMGPWVGPDAQPQLQGPFRPGRRADAGRRGGPGGWQQFRGRMGGRR